MNAAKKKDFSNIVTNNVYNAIAEATADPAEETAHEVIEIEEESIESKEPVMLSDNETGNEQEKQTRKERKTYSEEELKEFKNTLKTQGRKGAELPRMNMAFRSDIYDYIKTMSRASGCNLTEFVNIVMMQHKAAHEEDYKKALEFRINL